MNSLNTNIDQLTDHLFRHESGKMVAVLTKIFGTENLELAEDVVQESLLSAIKTWKLKGIPPNPSAWLFQTAKNKAIDAIRRNKFSTRIDFSDPERKLLRSEYTLSSVMDTHWKEETINDDLLRMMYACCYDEIAPENQITLILKTLCGFSTIEISKAFLTSEDTISKRLYRTKEFFREKRIKPRFPDPSELKSKTEAVLKAIYLIFNEGYNSTNNDKLIRKDLLEQAMYLCKVLCDNPHTQLPEVYAAMALMCFHAARIDSRVTEEGEIVLLADQDRTKWDKELINRGNQYMGDAAFGESISQYHLEAAIAYEHCTASSYQKTNWKQILRYYDWLSHILPTPVVQLNRLTVVFKIYGAKTTLEEINRSPFREEWNKNYLYHSLLGELYTGSDNNKAKDSYTRAIELTHSEAEKKLLRRKMALLPSYTIT